MKKRVLLIGWDAADWKIITPLLDSGQLPALESLINRGVMGKISTLDPTLSPMLWTSIATGKTADKHGILGFIEPTPEADGIRPVTVTSRKVKSIWNILHHHQKKVNIINWWPSYPAEPVNGVIVSNTFVKAASEPAKNEIPRIVHPESWFLKLNTLKVHPEDITDKEILNFIPDASLIDQETDKRLVKLSIITAENLSVYYTTMELMKETDWDMTAVYFGGIDQYCHQFVKYHPPKLDSVSDADFHIYHDVINAAYRFHDEMLKRMLELTDEQTTVILLSDHGFHADHLRPQRLPDFTAAAAMEHSPYGIFCMAGPDIKKDERIYGASLLDITPTLLTLFDLPIGSDMDGKPLLEAFAAEKKISFIDSWEDVSGDFGLHKNSVQSDAFASAAAMQQLIELGYIEDPGTDVTKAVKKTIEEANYNLARTFITTRRYKEALPLVEDLFRNNEKDIRFNLDLLRCYIELREFEKAEKLIHRIEELKEGNRPSVDLLKGILLLQQRKINEAIEVLEAVEKQHPEFPNLQTNLGNAYLKAGLYQYSIKAYQNALKVDEGNAGALRGIAICYLRLKEYENAAEMALAAIALYYNMPLAHYHLGEALFYLKKYQDAANAFELSLKMSPTLYKSRLRLVKIYTQYLKNSQLVIKHQQILNTMIKGEIVIVSGLPRSGTSMMMQLLHAGGMDVLTDNIRKPDVNNPHGYFEFEPVKKLKDDSSFLEQANGKTVKIIAQLLKYLPENYRYKIIFMKRDIHEIIASQQKMLGKHTNNFPLSIAQVFENELENIDIWALKEPNVELLYMNYSDVINDTENQLKQINDFLGNTIDTNKMKLAIDANLYRNKIQPVH